MPHECGMVRLNAGVTISRRGFGALGIFGRGNVIDTKPRPHEV